MIGKANKMMTFNRGMKARHEVRSWRLKRGNDHIYLEKVIVFIW